MIHATHPASADGPREPAGQAVSYFDHQGLEIRCVFSLLSGRERIYVDGKLVSESTHQASAQIRKLLDEAIAKGIAKAASAR